MTAHTGVRTVLTRTQRERMEARELERAQESARRRQELLERDVDTWLDHLQRFDGRVRSYPVDRVGRQSLAVARAMYAVERQV